VCFTGFCKRLEETVREKIEGFNLKVHKLSLVLCKKRIQRRTGYYNVRGLSDISRGKRVESGGGGAYFFSYQKRGGLERTGQIFLYI